MTPPADREIPPLACTVRDCGLLLERHGPSLRCARGHTYDIARRGYVNLLQPQDRKSPAAGDRAAAVAARARLLEAGVGRALLDEVAARTLPLLPPDAVVVDLGCGSGEALAALRARAPIRTVGVDLSVPAIEQAARQFPALTWVVANADRRLPLLDRSVDLVVSLHARRNPAECERILVRGGHLLVVVPAADDLIELRALVQGRGVERERGGWLEEAHAPFFDVAARAEMRERRHLARGALADLLRGTYRGERRQTADRLAGVEALDVTLASDLFLFRRRG